MDREYYFMKDGRTMRIFGTTYGSLLNDKREGRYIGKLYYDIALEEITFQPQLGIMGQSEKLIQYLNELIKNYGDEIKNGEQKIL